MVINAVGYQTGKYQVLENQARVSVVGNVKENGKCFEHKGENKVDAGKKISDCFTN